jgi:hypothetical protein
MGVVYEAEQLSLKRRVALKVLSAQALGGAEARFRREAELIARLHHTHIVPVIAFGNERGWHYYAMPLIDGRGLDAVRAAEACPLDPRRVAGWGLQAAEALAHAHARGIIHRDIKPSNLLLDPEEVVWLTDFGLARPVGETALTAPGALLGTPRYMSPEQLVASDAADERSDVYSLGATLYELVTGRYVFAADNLARLLVEVRESEPVPPRRLRPDLPRDLETVLLTCLAKDPGRRYARAQDLADDLRAVRDGRPIRARRPSFGERAARWLARQRFTPRVVAAVVGWVAVAAVWAVLLAQELSGPPTTPVLITENLGQPSAEKTFTVEILHPDREELAVPPINVPMTAAVTLPTGEFRLRLSRPGWLSATYPLQINTRSNWFTVRAVDAPGGKLQLVRVFSNPEPLNLPRPHLWPQPTPQIQDFAPNPLTHPLHGAALVQPVPARPGSDLVALYYVGAGPIVRRLRGPTGQPLWECRLDGDKYDRQTGKGYLGRKKGCLPPLAVVGENLIFADPWRPALVCLAADTGKVRWVHDGGVGELPFPHNTWVLPVGGAVSRLLTCDVGNPPRPGVVACLIPDPDLPPELWALAADTGQCVWRVPLPVTAPTAATLLYDAVPEPTLATTGGRPVVVCYAGDQVVGVEPSAGGAAWAPRRLPCRPVHPPRFADVDGDGDTDVLILDAPQPGLLRLTALRLASGQRLWEYSWPGEPDSRTRLDKPWYERVNKPRYEPDWPLVADLDGDGRPEVLVRGAGSHPAPQLPRPEGTQEDQVEAVDLIALSGASGQPLWRHRLGRAKRRGYHELSQPQLRLAVGPDLDGDGHREVFAASVLERWQLIPVPPTELYIDALSGKTGQSLWWVARTLSRPYQWPNRDWVAPEEIFISGHEKRRAGPLIWWGTGPAGTPLLAVTLGNEFTEGEDTLVVDMKGRVLHLVPGFSPQVVVDLDGDGQEDLLGTVLDGEPSFQDRPQGWSVLAGWAPGVVAATGEAPGGPEDPRRRIPLPWARTLLGASLQSSLSKILLHPRVVLVMLPLLMFWVSLVYWLRARWHRGGKAVDPARRRRNRWAQAICFVLAALTSTALGAVWLFLAADDLAPGEAYLWSNRYYQWFIATSMLWLIYLLLFRLWLLAVRLFLRPNRVT